jgi:hypothetical protein
VKIAVITGGSSQTERDGLAGAIRDGILHALPDSDIVTAHDARAGSAELAIVATEHAADAESLRGAVRELQSAGVPVVWLYPEGAEHALGKLPRASFALLATSSGTLDPLRSAALVAGSVARIAAIGRGLP